MSPVTGDGEIMGNHENRTAVFFAQTVEQVQNLTLDRDVQSTRGLVGDDQPGSKSNGDGNEHALLHASREFMGKLRKAPSRIGQPNLLQKGQRMVMTLLPTFGGMQTQNFPHLSADGNARVKRTARILRDEPDLTSTDGIEGA